MTSTSRKSIRRHRKMIDNKATRRRRNESFYQVSHPGFYDGPGEPRTFETIGMGPRYPRSAFAC